MSRQGGQYEYALLVSKTNTQYYMELMLYIVVSTEYAARLLHEQATPDYTEYMMA
jgi:hypothetical protein